MKLLTAVILIALCTGLSAQSAAPGHRLFGRLQSGETHLVDVNGSILHTWTSAFSGGTGVYLESDGTLLRAARTAPGQLPGGAGGGLQRIAFDGTLIWDFRYQTGGNIGHHDLHPLPNGNVLMIAWETLSVTEAINAGRSANLINGNIFRPDHIIEVQQTGFSTGMIVWEWHVMDHVIQDQNPAAANFGVVGNHPELIDLNFPPIANQASDFNHCNGIHYDPIHDWILLSSNRQGEIWIIDHSTTTAEAAGHSGGNWGQGGDLLYRWGNPQAYDRGTPADQQFSGQHSPRFIPAGYPGEGNVTVFSNNGIPGGSEVIEIVLPTDSSGNFVLNPGSAYGPAAPIWSYSAPGFYSTNISGAERLANGNTLICEGRDGRIFEVTPAGLVVFDYQFQTNPLSVFHAHYTEHSLWASATTLSVGAGGTVDFDLLAGTQNTGNLYALAATASGTSPGITLGSWTVPLNFDAVTAFSLQFANTPPLSQNLGTVAPNGRATAQLIFPAGSPPSLAGANLHLAFAVFDPANNATWASNPSPLQLIP